MTNRYTDELFAFPSSVATVAIETDRLLPR
jgi:hypothetical protein